MTRVRQQRGWQSQTGKACMTLGRYQSQNTQLIGTSTKLPEIHSICSYIFRKSTQHERGRIHGWDPHPHYGHLPGHLPPSMHAPAEPHHMITYGRRCRCHHQLMVPPPALWCGQAQTRLAMRLASAGGLLRLYLSSECLLAGVPPSRLAELAQPCCSQHCSLLVS